MRIESRYKNADIEDTRNKTRNKTIMRMRSDNEDTRNKTTSKMIMRIQGTRQYQI